MTGGSVIMFYLENERKGHLKTRNNQKKLLAGLQPGRVCYEKCFLHFLQTTKWLESAAPHT